MRPRIPKNVFLAVDARRYGIYGRSFKSMYRYNNRLMSNLVASPNWFFKRVMKKETHKTVEFDCPDKLYAMNNRECYALRGPRGVPTLIYTIRDRWNLCTRPARYEAQMSITRAGMSNPNPPKTDLRLLLTYDSFLEVREENTGKMINRIDLNSPDSPHVKFNVMRWDPGLDQVIVISTRPKKETIILCYLIVFGICPEMRKILRIPIRKDVFGRDIIDVVLLEGILKVMHRNEIVKLYDFDLISRNNRIVDGVHDKILDIANPGEPLFVVNNTSEMPEFHGHPWHYIACSRRQKEYTVRTMDHRILGRFPLDEFETVVFHPDDSGVISYGHRGAITTYKVAYDETKNTETLKKLREIKLVTPDENETSQFTQHALPLRRSQRRTRITTPMDEDERVLLADDFENELNMNVLMGTDMSDFRKPGVIQLFDNETGHLVKTMRFERHLREDTDYTITLDLDVLIVFAYRQNQRRGRAHVYRLLHREAWGDENPEKPYELPCTSIFPQRDFDSDYIP